MNYKFENDNLILNNHIINDFKSEKVITKNNFRNRCTTSTLLIIEPDKIYHLNSLGGILVPGDRSEISHSKNWDIFKIVKQYTGQVIYVKLFRKSPRGEAAFKVFCDFLNVKVETDKDE